MTTTIIFNTDPKLKKAAMQKARKQGITLTTVLNLATRKFVDDELEVDIIARDIAAARADIRAGKFLTAAEMRRSLGIK